MTAMTALDKAREKAAEMRAAGVKVGRIGSCELTRCPLHPVRPWQRGEEDEGEA